MIEILRAYFLDETEPIEEAAFWCGYVTAIEQIEKLLDEGMDYRVLLSRISEMRGEGGL